MLSVAERTSRVLRGAALAAMMVAGAAAGAPAALAQQGPGGPAEVTVVTLHKQDVTLTARLPGRVVASGTAEVRPQVNGIIVERMFEEGEPVEIGQPLYRLDDATYRAVLAAAKARLAQARAQLSRAEKEAERIKELTDRNVASTRNLDEALADREGAVADVQLAEAQLQSAQIDLDRTVIRAPLSGVIGRMLTTEGALVSAGQGNPLAVIRTLDPILVDVTQSAAEIVAWRRGQTTQRLADADPAVRLLLADDSTYEHTGFLRAAEPYVQEQTGVVTLRMQFPNPRGLLLPGMYVQVMMPQGVARDVVLAPQEGVSRDRRGNPQALVVNGEGKVEPRQLTIVQAQGSNWIVSAGLDEGDRLIVAGLQKIAPGMPVKPVERRQPVAEAERASGSETRPVAN